MTISQSISASSELVISGYLCNCINSTSWCVSFPILRLFLPRRTIFLSGWFFW